MKRRIGFVMLAVLIALLLMLPGGVLADGDFVWLGVDSQLQGEDIKIWLLASESYLIEVYSQAPLGPPDSVITYLPHVPLAEMNLWLPRNRVTELRFIDAQRRDTLVAVSLSPTSSCGLETILFRSGSRVQVAFHNNSTTVYRVVWGSNPDMVRILSGQTYQIAAPGWVNSASIWWEEGEEIHFCEEISWSFPWKVYLPLLFNKASVF